MTKEQIGKLEPNSLKRTTCPRISANLHFRFGRFRAYGLGEELIFGLISLHFSCKEKEEGKKRKKKKA